MGGSRAEHWGRQSRWQGCGRGSPEGERKRGTLMRESSEPDAMRLEPWSRNATALTSSSCPAMRRMVCTATQSHNVSALQLCGISSYGAAGTACNGHLPKHVSTGCILQCSRTCAMHACVVTFSLMQPITGSSRRSQWASQRAPRSAASWEGIASITSNAIKAVVLWSKWRTQKRTPPAASPWSRCTGSGRRCQQ